jgi:hypothetical protein
VLTFARTRDDWFWALFQTSLRNTGFEIQHTNAPRMVHRNELSLPSSRYGPQAHNLQTSDRVAIHAEQHAICTRSSCESSELGKRKASKIAVVPIRFGHVMRACDGGTKSAV